MFLSAFFARQLKGTKSRKLQIGKEATLYKSSMLCVNVPELDDTRFRQQEHRLLEALVLERRQLNYSVRH